MLHVTSETKGQMKLLQGKKANFLFFEKLVIVSEFKNSILQILSLLMRIHALVIPHSCHHLAYGCVLRNRTIFMSRSFSVTAGGFSLDTVQIPNRKVILNLPVYTLQ